MAVAENGGAARLTLEDKHGDIVGNMSATNGAATALDQSTAFDPFGQVRGTATAEDAESMDGNVGYQGDWTDPDTDQVNMHARWYDPGTGAFDSRDSYTYSSGASILANRYTYGAGAPLDYTDPDGHWPSCGWCKKAAKWAGNKITRGASYAYKTAKPVWHGVQWAWRHPGAALNKALSYVGKAANYLRRKSGLKTVVDATSTPSDGSGRRRASPSGPARKPDKPPERPTRPTRSRARARRSSSSSRSTPTATQATPPTPSPPPPATPSGSPT
jgi:RHS repeat-associated protein